VEDVDSTGLNMVTLANGNKTMIVELNNKVLKFGIGRFYSPLERIFMVSSIEP